MPLDENNYDTRDYDERHPIDTNVNIPRHLLKVYYGAEFTGMTEFIQGGLERDLDRQPMKSFNDKVRSSGGLTAYARDLLNMHAAWGVHA